MTAPLDRIKAALADRYSIQRELGEGGMATVFLAHDAKHDRVVAIKVLRQEFAAVLGAERFHQEITITANLQHPHILPLHDSGEADGFLYYVMPYVEGESLRERMTREGQLPIDEALRLTREVADALDYAHEAGVIHRDIKPENIMLSRGHALIADFGIAAAVDRVGGERLTETGLAIGTPHYMSPEQAVGTRELDGRSDVYSLGCVLYEMLAGEPPHTGPSVQAIIARRISEAPRAIGTIRPGVTAQVEAVTSKALASSPADRYASAAAFVVALDQSLTSSSTPTLAGVRVLAAKRRYRRSVWVGGALALVAGVALVFGPLARRGGVTEAPRIAVIPFSHVGIVDDEFFADGVTELITTRLASGDGLRVVSRSSAALFKDSDRAASDIGNTLGVDYVLTGIVRTGAERNGERSLRVTPVLVRVEDDVEVWSQRYNATLEAAIFVVQEEIAGQVASAMNVVFRQSDSEWTGRLDAVDPLALESYMLGRFMWRKQDPQSLLAAQQHFRDAVERDSSFAPAWSGLADAIMLYRFHWDRGSKSDDYQRAVALVRRAIALDDNLAEAHASLAFALSYGEFDWDGGEVELRRAIALDPDNANFHVQYGGLHDVKGRVDLALAELDEALQLDPLLINAHITRGSILLLNDRRDEAKPHFHRAIELESNTPAAYWPLVWIYADRREWDSAMVFGHQLQEIMAPGAPPVPASIELAVFNSFAPGADEADVLTTVAVFSQPGDEFFPTLFYTIAGMTDSVFAALGRAADQRNEVIPHYLRWIERVTGQDDRFVEVRRRFGIE